MLRNPVQTMQLLGMATVGAIGTQAAISNLQQKEDGCPIPRSTPFPETETSKRTFRHYGYTEDALLLSNGLKPMSYATHAYGQPMSGTMAQELLALPHSVPPNAYYTVTVGPEVEVIGPNPVKATDTPPRIGGGVEYIFPFGTPPGSVKGPYPLPNY